MADTTNLDEEKKKANLPAPKKEKLAKKPLTLLSREDHQKEVEYSEKFEIINTLDRPLSVNLCGGRNVKMWTKDEHGNRKMDPDIKDPCRRCPGLSTHLNGLERKLVQVPMMDCLVSDQSSSLLEQSRTIKIKKLDADGNFDGKAESLIRTLSC